MRNILILFTITLTVITLKSFASTDYQCVSDCSQKGYQYQLCVSKCSFDNNYQTFGNSNLTKQTDYQCVNQCSQKGYQYGYCQSICSY